MMNNIVNINVKTHINSLDFTPRLEFCVSINKEALQDYMTLNSKDAETIKQEIIDYVNGRFNTFIMESSL